MVTDADRQAAEQFRQSTMTLSEAFAAHREAAERAGAQAMRERAAKVCEALEDWEQLGSDEVAACIRALPTP